METGGYAVCLILVQIYQYLRLVKRCILSATMFKHMNYYVDNLQKDNKQLTIYHTRAMYGTGINAVSSKGKKKVIKYNSYIMSEDRIE